MISLSWAVWTTSQLSSYIHTAVITSTGMFSFAKSLDPNSQFFDKASAATPGAQSRQTIRKLYYGWGQPIESAGDSLRSMQMHLYAAQVLLVSALCLGGVACRKVCRQEFSARPGDFSETSSSAL